MRTRLDQRWMEARALMAMGELLDETITPVSKPASKVNEAAGSGKVFSNILSLGGGALMDNGIHIIDLARHLLGEVEEVFGFATNNVWRLNATEDNGCALLRGVNGKYATLQATWSEWKGYRFYVEVYGTKGMARAYYAPMMSLVVSMDATGARRRRQLNLYPLNIVREKLYGWQATARATFERELADFIGLCRGEPGAIADGFAGFRAVEIADAVYRSTRERQPIQLAQPF